MRYLKVITIILFYLVLSVTVTLMNKISFPRSTFPFPFTISCFQMIVALGWLLLLSMIQKRAPSWIELIGLPSTPLLDWSFKSMSASAGAAGAFMGMLSTGNLCLMFVQVSFYQAAKSLHIVWSLLLSYLLLKENQSLGVKSACMGVTAGFIVNTLAEVNIMETRKEGLDLLTMGCVAGLISSFFVALYPILVNRSIQRGLNKWQMSININGMSLAWYAPIVLFEAIYFDMFSAPSLYDVGFWGLNFTTASLGFLLNIAAILQVQNTSPLTHMVVGSVKGAVTSLLGVWIQGNVMSAGSWVGLLLLLTSTFAYSLLKVGQKSEKKPL